MWQRGVANPDNILNGNKLPGGGREVNVPLVFDSKKYQSLRERRHFQAVFQL